MASFIATDLVTTAGTVVGIVLVAFVTSQLVRRSIKRALRSLSQGTVKERLGARKPAMLHDGRAEHPLRAARRGARLKAHR